MDLEHLNAEIAAMERLMEERLRAMGPEPATREAAILAAIPPDAGEAKSPGKLGPFLGNLPKELLAEVVSLLEGVDAANFARVNNTCWNLTRPFEHWHFRRLDLVRLKERAHGVMTVRALVDDPSPDQHEHTMKGGTLYFYDPLVPASLQEVRDSMRYILITEGRSDDLDDALSFATCGQCEPSSSDEEEEEELAGGDRRGRSRVMFFNTKHGNEVILGIPDEVESVLTRVPAAARFDGLFALTSALHKYDAWLHDNESGCSEGPNELEVALGKLSRAWQILLATQPVTRLGADVEFTIPGVYALLEDFETKISETALEYEDVDLSFNWRPPEQPRGREDDDDDDDDEGGEVEVLIGKASRHFDLLDETCARLHADRIFVTGSGGDHTGDIESTRKVILTSGRLQAIEEAESFVMGGIQIGIDEETGLFEFHHKENSNNVCNRLAAEVERALARPSLPERFDALFALTRQLNMPHESSGHFDHIDSRLYPLSSPGEWMMETDMWRPGQAMEVGVARLAAGWRELFRTHSNAQLCVDEAFSRPGVEALLDEFQKKLDMFAVIRGGGKMDLFGRIWSNPIHALRYNFDWRPEQ